MTPAGALIARLIGWILVACGSIGLAAAVALMVEKVWLLEDPTHVPSCSFDAVLACASVMTSDQAEAFGIPNPLIGIAGFAAVVALGLAVVTGSRLSRGVWLTIHAGVTFAVLFVHWLFFQSVYRIEALCPYCMVVWAATIPLFLYVTLFNLVSGHLGRRASVARVVQYHGVILTLWFAVIALLIGQAFWDHWRAQF